MDYYDKQQSTLIMRPGLRELEGEIGSSLVDGRPGRNIYGRRYLRTQNVYVATQRPSLYAGFNIRQICFATKRLFTVLFYFFKIYVVGVLLVGECLIVGHTLSGDWPALSLARYSTNLFVHKRKKRGGS